MIDDRGLVARRPVDLRELASQYQSRLHTSEIFGADGQHGCPGPIAHIGYRRSFNLELIFFTASIASASFSVRPKKSSMKGDVKRKFFS